MYIYISLCVCVGARHPMFAGVSFVRGAPRILHLRTWPEVRFLHTGNCHVALHHPLQDAFREAGLGKAMRWNHGWSFGWCLAWRSGIWLAVVCGVVLVGCVQQQGTLKSTMIYQFSSAKQMDTKKFFWDNGGKAIISDCHCPLVN